MKKINLIGSALLMTLTFHEALALECPDKNSAPVCPTSGATLLDETYPTQAFVISNQPYMPTKDAKKVTRNFVSKVIANYDYEKVPQIILPMTDKKDFDVLVADIKNQLTQKNLPEEKINAIIGQITYTPIQSYTWQQDWFESFVDLKTGSPSIRQIDSYNRVWPDSGEKLSKAGAQCEISQGANIKEAYSPNASARNLEDVSFGSGEMGGNIEGAPGGFCLVGDNQGSVFTNQFCGSPENVIQLQTSWLAVGHVDEIFKIIPTQYNDGRPKECEFSLMAASPKKALELMSNPKQGQIPFMDLDINNPDKDAAESRNTRTNIRFGGNYVTCEYINDIVKKRPGGIKTLPAGARTVLLKLIFGNAQAQDVSNEEKMLVELQNNCSNNIDQVSNYEIQEVMKLDKRFTTLNDAINESIEKDKALIKSKILSRLPQCAKYYDELDVPNIFYGGYTMENPETKKVELAKPGSTNSFLPNPTNSVLMNKTVVFPDTGNNLFNGYLKDEMKKRKIKSDFISSWDYAHLGAGNIHCSSHSIPHCRPAGK
nr:resolvase [Bacteriovorax sp. HI3]